MGNAISSRSFVLLFRFMQWLLDQGKESDLRLLSPLSLEQVMIRLTGESNWDTIFTFDAIGHKNGLAVDRFFEIPFPRKGYTSMLPIPLTHDYPSNYALVGSLQLLPGGKTLIKGRFRLSNLRTIFFALLVLIVIFLLIVGLFYSIVGDKIQLSTISIGFILLIFPVLLIPALVSVSMVATLFEPSFEKQKVLEYVRNLVEPKSFPGNLTQHARGQLGDFEQKRKR